MPFAADSSARRTVDDELGYELFFDGGGPDGTQKWRITRADGRSISFATAWEPNFVEEWRQRNPQAHKPAIYLIGPMRGQFPDLGRDGSDALIVDALQAFQGFHGQPDHADVAIFFEPAGLSRGAPNWWAPILDD